MVSFTSPAFRFVILGFGFTCVFYYIFRRQPARLDQSRFPHYHSSNNSNEVELVVSSVAKTNTTWIHEHIPHYPASIYIADDPSANLTVTKNKGHESTVYLTHIIENYDHLPAVLIFLHGHRYQWHNEDPLYDGVPPIRNLSIPYVHRHKFATLRCTWELGCPREMTPDLAAVSKEQDENADDRAKTEAAYAQAFTELFPGEEIPEAVAVHCGAQFAAARDLIRRRSREEYIAFRRWLWDTELPDYLSGRVMEYAWHIILGQPPILCPHAGRCFCEKFGLCDLVCAEHGCAKRYWFKFGELPDKWPDEGSGTDGWPPRNWAY